MDAIILQILNGLDKGSAYALIALGLTLIFGTLGVVNFAHGALFMIGAFCAVTLQRLLSLSYEVVDESRTDFLGNPMTVEVPYVYDWFGESTGQAIINWSVPLAVLFSIPVMILLALAMERGLIKHFYKRPHVDQILVTFGLAIVLQEIIKYFFGANPIPAPAPTSLPARSISARSSAPTRSRSSIPTGGWSISRFPWPSSAPSSPSCSSPPSAWSCAPAWPTARRWACWASTSTGALPRCSRSPPASPALPG